MSIAPNDKRPPAALSTQSVSGAALALLAGTAVSKVLGFVRDVLIASFFGASASMDAFLVALSVPSIIGYALGSSLSAAFVPVSSRMQHSPGSNTRLLNRSVVVVAAALSGALMIAVIAGARPLILAIAPELPIESVTTTVILTRVMSLLIIGYVLYYLTTGIYHARSHFITPSWIQPAENIIVIVLLLALQAFLGINALILATVAGIMGIMSLMLIPLVRSGELSATGSAMQKETTAVLKGAAPLVVVYCVYQGYFLIERYFASGLSAGSISSLTYARRVIELPTIFFVSTLSSALYPRLASLHIQGDRESMASMLSSAARKLIYVLVPISVILFLKSEQVVTLLFQRGAFTMEAVHSTSTALRYYSLGLLPLAAVALTSRILYAMHNMRVPFLASLAGVAVSIFGNIMLLPVLGLGGIALSSTMMIGTIFMVQFAYLHISGIALPYGRIASTATGALISAAAAVIAIYAVGDPIDSSLFAIPIFLFLYTLASMVVLRRDVKEIRDLIMNYFPKDKSHSTKESPEQMTLENILPKIREDQL